MNRPPYPTDFNDAEWHLLEPPAATAQARRITHQIPPPGNRRHHPLHPVHRRRLAYAPHNLPPYRIVFHYYRTWQQVNDALRQQTRQSQGRHLKPGAAIMDSQSVKTTEKGAQRLRCGQKSDGAQAAYCGGHGGIAAVGGSASGGRPGSRRRPAGAVPLGPKPRFLDALRRRWRGDRRRWYQGYR